jgi:hypothetical protein
MAVGMNIFENLVGIIGLKNLVLKGFGLTVETSLETERMI